MNMNTEIRRAASGDNLWNLYVNGHLAVSLESMGVCESVAAGLRTAQPIGTYSEGAEIADAIRRARQAA